MGKDDADLVNSKSQDDALAKLENGGDDDLGSLKLDDGGEDDSTKPDEHDDGALLGHEGEVDSEQNTFKSE